MFGHNLGVSCFGDSWELVLGSPVGLWCWVIVGVWFWVTVGLWCWVTVLEVGVV